MKMNLKSVAMFLAVLGLCLTARAEYCTNVAVAPTSSNPGNYVVQFKVTQKTGDGKEELLCAPRVTVKLGEPGRVAIGDEKSSQSITCEVLVNESKGTVEATATIKVNEGGAEKFATTQQFSLSPR